MSHEIRSSVSTLTTSSIGGMSSPLQHVRYGLAATRRSYRSWSGTLMRPSRAGSLITYVLHSSNIDGMNSRTSDTNVTFGGRSRFVSDRTGYVNATQSERSDLQTSFACATVTSSRTSMTSSPDGEIRTSPRWYVKSFLRVSYVLDDRYGPTKEWRYSRPPSAMVPLGSIDTPAHDMDDSHFSTNWRISASTGPEVKRAVYIGGRDDEEEDEEESAAAVAVASDGSAALTP
mmetsp:Transcript_7906/g.23383  ORF Transcript_7906/g.23383 Transcript_7906/m.23383 type:complete len:231 (+) Transcript_7906:2063-2755(+)